MGLIVYQVYLKTSIPSLSRLETSSRAASSLAWAQPGSLGPGARPGELEAAAAEEEVEEQEEEEKGEARLVAPHATLLPLK